MESGDPDQHYEYMDLCSNPWFGSGSCRPVVEQYEDESNDESSVKEQLQNLELRR